MWRLLIDKEIMKPFEEALDEFSLWRAGAGYVSRAIEGVAILSNHNEDAVAAIGPDSRANVPALSPGSSASKRSRSWESLS